MPESFAEVVVRASGSRPYPYQRRLADDGLPELLAVETGAGKTAGVFFAWLWRRRFHPDPHVRRSTPHWLVFCEPMRTLTEQVEGVISEWVHRLGLDGEVLVHVVMGGREEGQRQWRLHPERDAVVIGTADMLLSRALDRGYGASPFAWPIDFGVLNNGTHWVFDEVQLLGPALPTGRQLQAFRDAMGTAMGTSSTWMSATVDRSALSTVDNPWTSGSSTEVRLAAGDRSDPELAVRLDAGRCVRRVELGAKDRPAAIARAAVDLHRAGTLTLVVVNRVATAQGIFDALRKLRAEPPVYLLHGRFRPADRRRATAAALDLGEEGGGRGRIVVSTQVVEAGVDISADVLLTEAAPWPSIVQRAGRCNRDGKAPEAILAWVPIAEKDAAPYRREDVVAAMAALEAMEGQQVTVTMLGERPVPVVPSHQPVLRRADLLGLFDTAPDVSGNDVDVGPFIRDGDERDVLVAWRDGPGGRPPDGTRLARDELCPVPLGKEPERFLRQHGWRFDHLGHGRHEWVKLGPGDVLRPGAVLVVPGPAGGYDPERGWTPRAKASVPPVDGVGAEVRDPADPTEPLGGDSTTQVGEWVTLRRHLDDVEKAVRELSRDLAPEGLTGAQLEAAAVAGRLHDIGKAHPVFQDSLLRLVPDSERGDVSSGGPWAKSGSSGLLRHQRRGFRHELASALALLGDGGIALRAVEEPDLVVYLVAAHHGRVRLGIRSALGVDDEDQVLGVEEGDAVPRVEIPGGETPPLRLSLDPMRLGRAPGDGRASWSERALRLLGEIGPFRLGYLEALVRLADWRASAAVGAGNGVGVAAP
ncbi:MAG: type I-G CRISPR-associated helicase/endonuclease Cas3g [Acidimicrobiales bacterium]